VNGDISLGRWPDEQPGCWGADYDRGTVNLIAPERVVEADPPIPTGTFIDPGPSLDGAAPQPGVGREAMSTPQISTRPGMWIYRGECSRLAWY
jgi:hypothetical protein